MLAVLTERTEEIQRFRSAPWWFQQTFTTPLKELDTFVSTFLAPFSLEKGALNTDQVVFEAQNLLRLLASQSLSVDNYYELKIEALGQPEIANLLRAALGDCVDLFSFPRQKSLRYTPTTMKTQPSTLKMMRR